MGSVVPLDRLMEAAAHTRSNAAARSRTAFVRKLVEQGRVEIRVWNRDGVVPIEPEVAGVQPVGLCGCGCGIRGSSLTSSLTSSATDKSPRARPDGPGGPVTRVGFLTVLDPPDPES